MPIQLSIETKGLNEIGRQFAKHPQIVSKRIGEGIAASIFDIERSADDSGDSGLFRFKTPRPKRTGYLARSFSFGRVLKPLYGSIGPTANYADKVNQSNPFMQRIADANIKNVQKNFDDAMQNIADDITNT
jgi:hypothetical protein